MNAIQSRTIGLVLQGGGALGAYELGVIEYLWEKVLEGKIKIEIVSGVSIGAVNATLLCGARTVSNPLETLIAVWEELTTFDIPFLPREIDKLLLSAFGNPAMYRPRTDFYKILEWTGFSDTSPLRETLKKHVAFDDLRPENESRPRLILAATNIETGEIDAFDSRKMQIEPDHVLASGALPPGFSPASARDQHGHTCTYVDGGLFNNTPLSPVIEALEEKKNGKHQKVDLMVVVNLFPRKGQVPKHMLEVMDRYYEILFVNKTSSDIQRAEQTRKLIELRNELENLVKRLDLPQESRSKLEALKAHPGYAVLNKWAPVFDHLIEIENTEAEPMDAATDFTKETIERRRRAGYRDAKTQCKEYLEEFEYT